MGTVTPLVPAARRRDGEVQLVEIFVSQLRVGDRVDLEDDLKADPMWNGSDMDHPVNEAFRERIEAELLTVAAIEDSADPKFPEFGDFNVLFNVPEDAEDYENAAIFYDADHRLSVALPRPA